jgi:hypothetical protein
MKPFKTSLGVLKKQFIYLSPIVVAAGYMSIDYNVTLVLIYGLLGIILRVADVVFIKIGVALLVLAMAFTAIGNEFIADYLAVDAFLIIGFGLISTLIHHVTTKRRTKS